MRQSYDVVIVGGGAMGAGSAYFLASDPDFDGSVLVVERDPSYQSCATTRSLGGIRQQFTTPENIRMSMFGAEFARAAAETLAVEGQSADVTFREQGYLFTATAEGAAALRANYELQRSLGAEVTFLEPAALATRFPWLNTDGLGAAVFGHANEGWVDPNTLLQGFRRKARALGAEFVADEVVGFTRQAGRVTGVVLADGAEIGAGTVVIAAGSRSGALCRHLDFEFPVRPRKRYVYVFDCRDGPGPMPQTFDTNGVYVRYEGDGYICGTSPPLDRDDPCWDFEVEYELFEEVVWPTLARRIPAFEAIKLRNAWACHYDYHPLDENAVIGPHPEVGNFYFANGFSGHGVQQSPAAGRAIAELLTHGEYRALDLSRLGYARTLSREPLREEEVVEAF